MSLQPERQADRLPARRTGRSPDSVSWHAPRDGFTLIELMIALVIMGVLAGIAYSAYQNAMRAARRAEGKTALLSLMQQQERVFSLSNRYVPFSSASTDPEAVAFRWYSGSSARKSAYEIMATSCDDASLHACIRLTAKPGTDKVDGSFHDEECGELSLDSYGAQTASGRGASACWQ